MTHISLKLSQCLQMLEFCGEIGCTHSSCITWYYELVEKLDFISYTGLIWRQSILNYLSSYNCEDNKNQPDFENLYILYDVSQKKNELNYRAYSKHLKHVLAD